MKLQYIIFIVLSLAAVPFCVLLTLDHVAPHSYKTPSVEGTRNIMLTSGNIRYQSTGTGRNTILFLHGFNAHLGSWNKVWSKIDNCARTVRLDIPGFGNSDNWETDTYALPEQGKRIIEFMDTLELTRVTLVGITMGANLSAWLASHYPSRINGLVLISPSAYTNALQHTGLYGLLTKPGILNDIGVFIARRKLYRKLFPNSRALHSFTATSSYGQKWDAELKNIYTPTIILSSKNDRLIPIKYARATSSDIRNSIFISLSTAADDNIPHAQPGIVAQTACQISNDVNLQQISMNIREHLKNTK